ncbi:MAG: 50S ribosomal protein L21e [Candidatus Aenigmatarchaeota archaeon]
MGTKSHGPRKRTREKFRKIGRVTVNTYMRNFDIGSKVVIDIESSSLSGMPFKRFQGRHGKIVGKRGMAYMVEIKDINMTKKVIAKPEHLKAA